MAKFLGFNITLRHRIFWAMLLIIIVSFVATGFVYFQHFKEENRQYHQERLMRKEYAVNESLRYFLDQYPIQQNADSLQQRLDTEICQIANIHSMDINIYDLEGNLLISSNPNLYDQGIVPDRLERTLLQTIRRAPQPIVNESRRDSLTYLSTYDFVKNRNDKPVAIVNLPYFDTGEMEGKDVRDFLGQLLWAYSLLFLFSIALAYFLSNYISKSLLAIGEKLKNIQFNQPNPPLKWKHQDELGTLVDEYNRMLRELERSAVKLAQTERESAWKEMAKQVAHEIKNPLTPMRLNVQYLQKTLATEQPEKLQEFCESMVGQIDTLSSIAEAFARFAHLPEMQLERFPAHEIIQRVTALYPEYEIRFDFDDPNALIMADKDQLVRVMNNLINNAIQAIPEGREPEISVKMEQQDGDVLVAVEDNGSGIPEEQGRKIFEPRFTTKTKGMGLGLAMVKNIINSLRGTIWFDSELDKGTTFYFTLPRV